MMAAYQPQPGGMHPGMGHPAMAPNPNQHMGQPMMHPSASGPGQPHVTQAGAMMGIPGANGMGQPGMAGGQPPGAGGGMNMGGQPGMGGQNMPHMTQQQQQQMMQQQQHLQQMTPQLAMQQQQQQQNLNFIRHRQQMMQNGMLAQGGMQMAHFQANPTGAHPGTAGLQLPAHLQQQMQLRLQQHQHQQQQQQNHQAQLAQQMAMQHANSQQSNQGQSGPQPQQGAQPGQPAQMRPPSRMANPNESAQGAQQAHPQQASQGQPQPTPQPTPQPGQQQQVPPSQQQGMAAQNLQQRQRMQQHAMQLQQQQQQQQRMAKEYQMQAQAQVAQQQDLHPGATILRILLLGDDLSKFNADNGRDIAAWSKMVDKHFAPEGRFLHSFHDQNSNRKSKTYEIPRSTIARYFWTYFDSGASSLRLHIEGASEITVNGRYTVQCNHFTLTVAYPSGARLEMSGALQCVFAPRADNPIESLEIQQTGAEEVLSRSEIERVLNGWSPTLSTKSPKMAKNKLPKAQQKLQQQQQESLTIEHFPKTPKGTMGVTSRVQQFLEIGETMHLMADLMSFSQDHKMRPEPALEALVAQYDGLGAIGNPQINLPPNGIPMGQRTPSMQNMQMPPNSLGTYSSPSMSNMNLPNGMNGSPHLAHNTGLQPGMGMQQNSHTASPHQSNMAAPHMMAQVSQQGTNSSAASANTSPQVNNKRRRSTVKVEDDNPGGNDNNRVKPSPRMNKKSKPGG